eukprot:TRINITY_DN24350_c0_g1_i2.p1 TRINITY_DN24350_c0_g1~~TRINITY_DN24350_c0_g1_i2.p1  ORF type:complete len:134 (-),score=15.75 TRINITY_DN24350_c0_g1_i2:389-790(-)
MAEEGEPTNPPENNASAGPPSLPVDAAPAANPLTLRFAGIRNGAFDQVVRLGETYTRKGMVKSLKKAADYNHEALAEESNPQEVMYIARPKAKSLQTEVSQTLAEGPCIALGVAIATLVCCSVYYLHWLHFIP